MTQQQAAAGVVVVVVGAEAQKSKDRTEHQEDCAVLARPTPHDARLAQPCLAKHRQRMPLGHATILSRLVTAGWGGEGVVALNAG